MREPTINPEVGDYFREETETQATSKVVAVLPGLVGVTRVDWIINPMHGSPYRFADEYGHVDFYTLEAWQSNILRTKARYLGKEYAFNYAEQTSQS